MDGNEDTKRNERLHTGREVCELLSIKQSTLYGWSSQGKIQVIKVGSLNRYSQGAIEALLESKKEKSNGRK